MGIKRPLFLFELNSIMADHEITQLEQYRRMILTLQAEVDMLKKNIFDLEAQKTEAYKRITELTSSPDSRSRI